MSTKLDDVVADVATAPPPADTIAGVRPAGRRRWILLSWAAVLALGAAAALLFVSATGSDRRSVDLDSARTVAEHGSVGAIDHRDAVVVETRQAPSLTVAEHGSVSAIDHRDALVVAARQAPSRTVAEHGSVSAIDHRDAEVARS